MQQVNVSDRVLDVGRKVRDLSPAAGGANTLQMIVDPTYENLFGRQHHQIVQRFTFL